MACEEDEDEEKVLETVAPLVLDDVREGTCARLMPVTGGGDTGSSEEYM